MSIISICLIIYIFLITTLQRRVVFELHMPMWVYSMASIAIRLRSSPQLTIRKINSFTTGFVWKVLAFNQWATTTQIKKHTEWQIGETSVLIRCLCTFTRDITRTRRTRNGEREDGKKRFSGPRDFAGHTWDEMRENVHSLHIYMQYWWTNHKIFH